MGQITFLDMEINEVWPEGVRRLLQASLLAHYQTIVCPQREQSGSQINNGEMEADIPLENEDEEEKKRVIRYRRAHLRNLPPDHRARARQLALAIESGKFNESDVDRIVREGRRQTFVRELVRSVDDLTPIDPRRLYRKISPIKFLNMYLAIAGY